MTRTNARVLHSKGSLRAGSRAAPVCSLALLLGATALLGGCSNLVAGSNGGAGSSSAGTASAAGAAGGAGGSTTGSAGGSSVGGASTAAPVCTAPAPGGAPIRRLTRFELNNTLRDLKLTSTTTAANQLPAELKGNGFSNDAATITATRALVDAYRSIASTLATSVTKDATALANLTTCDTKTLGEDACAQSFVKDFGQKAYRRPITDQEQAALMVAYTAGKTGATYAAGLEAVIEMALQSPQFLYRVEVGVPVPGKSVRRPTSYEMATRLSYALWGSKPDDRLLGVAAANGLDAPEQVQAQATLMLKDARAHDVLHYFTNTLYGIGGSDALVRDATAFPTYNTSLGPLFRKETETFIDDVVWNSAGDFATLWNAPYSFVNGPLAAFYGDTGVTGDAFVRVARDPARRMGLLTQASVLAATTPGARNNPVTRGKFIYEQILCGSVPSPPPSLMVKLPPEDATRTTRERFTAHRVVEPCKSCHVMLDPIGFGLENFDGVGLWRDMDNGKPVDPSGELPPSVDIAGPFPNAVGLAKKIASSEAARSCFADKWLSFAYGRVAGDGDACSKNQLESAFRASNGNIQTLLVAATQTDDFLYLPAGAP
ncbi:MAG: DUF1592 domain-containing protein [Pseudomonadota bacterium]